MTAVALDHVGVVTRDLAALAERYERLGFTLSPLARQADGRIGNRCAIMRRGYIELLAVVDPTAVSATLERFLARYAGVHILAFGFADENAELARLRRAGVEAPHVHRFDRPIDDRHPDGARARFALIQVPEQPEGLINLVRHLTPEALWQERFLRHPNKATALAEVMIAVDDPATTAARFSRLVGCPVVPDPMGGFALDLAHGRVRLMNCPPSVAAAPRVVSLTVNTSDRNKAIGRRLVAQGIAHCREADALLVDQAAAGGAAICFRPAP